MGFFLSLWYTIKTKCVNIVNIWSVELCGEQKGYIMNNKTIKELPEDQRPDEKCEMHGPEFLADAELLAVIIRTGYFGKSSVQLASDIIEAGGKDGILGLCRMNMKELQSIKGVGKVKAVQIMCICELAKRISKSFSNKKLIFDNPDNIASYYMEDMRHKIREEMKVIMLNSKSVYLGEVNVSVGTVNSSSASPREIFLEALRYKAVCIVLLHNHPSGDPTPSRQDIEVTGKICQAGELIGIKIVDHIIIGDNCYISLRERGILC